MSFYIFNIMQIIVENTVVIGNNILFEIMDEDNYCKYFAKKRIFVILKA